MSPGRTGDFLTGTRQAYDECPACRHARHLHPAPVRGGRPQLRAGCSGVIPRPGGDGFIPCPCGQSQDFKIGE